MTQAPCLLGEVETLADHIRSADSSKRLELQPHLDAVLKKLSQSGVHVPRSIRLLHDELLDEAIEARFDNIPI